ncbi:hypothetical protein P152DRAFT_457455 [Eremomyces bilateralis CBS 781.70]|uniref:ZZ-type domain-containing protein n=1 Tax=Eremomyces bilateralis CBS 781.70 TaxID=1392243 RepID=A0A6G1G7P5_9PEZI|nr:uncharacterized protein P152DRAFT_457455 [Eremomyces bilateralis CBS 781.70]KAF1814097.1 hypothetical protein P152DRAFT_457455 [Eremomyces bilateralis CBS 781.70]
MATKGVRGDDSFWCNCCFHDIYGPRFHCTVCNDFDLCLMCNVTAEDMHPCHDLQVVEQKHGEKPV